jgi:hypothetical protein
LGIATDELGRGRFQLVGQKQSWFLMAKIGNGKLLDRLLVVWEGDLPIQDFRCAIITGEGLKLYAPPSGDGLVSDFLEKVLGPSAQGDESDAHLVESVEVGIDGKLRIEYQFTFSEKSSVTFFPEFNKTKNLIVLVGFSNLGISASKQPLIGILSQESDDTLLPSAAF